GLSDGDFITIAGANDSRFNGFFGPITRDLLLPNTKFSYPVLSSDLPHSGSGGSFDKHVAAGVVRNGDVATVTTVAPDGFLFGQTFKLQGTFVNSTGDNGYNRVGTVKSFSVMSFSFDMKPVSGSVPPGTASPTGDVQYAAHWDIRYFAVENNIYDL